MKKAYQTLISEVLPHTDPSSLPEPAPPPGAPPVKKAALSLAPSSIGCLKFVTSQTVLERLRAYAFNSSHLVWMLSDFIFVQSTTGWIFALQKKLGVTLVALEPLPPYPHFLNQDFRDAVIELEASMDGTIAFVSINSQFATLLNEKGYCSLQIGKEPWVSLDAFEPSGKKSRGLKAAVKRATTSGTRVECLSLNDIARNPVLKSQVDAFHQHWTKNTFLSLEGFLLATNPWALTHDRLCFLALDRKKKLQGVLIATPLARRLNWYLEDLWLGPGNFVGVAELLTLEAFRKLKVLGAEKVSLGLVPLTDLGFHHNPQGNASLRPAVFRFSIGTLSKVIKTFYNAEGMIGFRKRFQIREWTPAYLSVKTKKSHPFFQSIQWIQVMAAIFLAHKPVIYWKNFFRKKYKASQH